MEQGSGQFHFNPETYLEMVISEVPAYEELEDRTAEATVGVEVDTILDLGTGTGETAVRVMRRHPNAHLLGIDESGEMLTHARLRLPEADFAIARLEDPLPPGLFDVVVSALAVHHLDGPAKADLFHRVAERLLQGGRFVMADVVIPDDPNDAVTPIDGVYDKPSRAVDLLRWLEDAGFDSRLIWTKQDLALFVADRIRLHPERARRSRIMTTTDSSNPPQQPDEQPEPEQPTDVLGAIPDSSPENGGPAVPPS